VQHEIEFATDTEFAELRGNRPAARRSSRNLPHA
jgi:hypothetical protein